MELTRGSRPWLSPLLVLLVLASCEPVVSGPGPAPGPGTGPGRAPVGRVRVDATVVLVNNQPVTGTVPLFIGDDVRTGNTGRATIFFDAGGTLVLGPNSDPLLQLVSEAGCLGAAAIQVLIRSGTFDFFNVTRVCFCDPQDVVCGVPASDFRVVITNTGARITVSRGALRVTVGRPPQQRQYHVVQGQGMNVQRGGGTSGPQQIIQ